MRPFLLLAFSIVSTRSSDVWFTSISSQIRSGVPFIGQYVGSSSDALSWSSPSSCEQTTISSSTEQFVCTTKGNVDITLTVGATPTSHSVDLLGNSECYSWDVDNSATEIKLMVKDSSGANSADISYQFFVLGEVPKVSLHCDKDIVELARPVFSENTKSWVYSVPSDQKHCTKVQVRGIPVSLNGCIVSDALLPLYSNVVLPEEGAAVATTSKSKVCRDYCGSGVTVLLNTTHVVVSNDGLETTLQLNLDKNVKDCGVIWGGKILLLVDNGNKLVIINNSTSSTLNLPFKADHISVNSKCAGIMEEMLDTSPLVVWSTSKMCVIYEDQVVDTITNLPQSMDSIEAVAVSYFGVMTVMKDGSKTYWLQYDRKTATFSTGYKLSIKCQSDCSMFGICAHMNLLVKNNNLYFITSNGRSSSSVTSHVDGTPLTTSVKDVAISSDDEWAVLSNDGKIYYGFCSRSAAMNIGTTETAEYLLFDSIGDFNLLKNNGEKTPVPTDVLIGNVFNSEPCTVKNFESTLPSHLINIDNGEEWLYNISLTSANFRYPRMLYQMYPPDHNTANITSTVSTSKLVRGDNTLSQNINITGNSNKGVSVVVATPHSEKPSCPRAKSDITYVVLDCPKNRNIRIKNKRTTCEDVDSMNMTYVIPSEYNNQNTNKVVEYNLAELGCPFIWQYQDLFVPEVWIYDDDVPVRKLERAYVIREMNDRHDFNFTLTTSTAGCKRDPQNRTTMGASWGREDYQDCFTEPVSGAALTTSKLQYEILNVSDTTQNKIEFQKHKARYTFEITVVDPQASYCDLQTKFSIWIEEAPSLTDMGMITLIVSFVGNVMGLFSVYIQYKSSKKMQQMVDQFLKP